MALHSGQTLKLLAFCLCLFFKPGLSFRTQVAKAAGIITELKAAGEKDNAPDGGPKKKLAPIVFVPGITSSALEARRTGEALGDPGCEGHIPKTGLDWYNLYVSTGQATNVGCFLWQLQLQPPKPAGSADACVSDAQGIEVREVGFGSFEGAASLNPGELIPMPLYEEMIKMFESVGLKRGSTIRFATYDWRKYGDPCWEKAWFPRLTKLIEDTATQSDGSIGKITLGCHSMGCPLSHVFLDSRTQEWKDKYVGEFLATGPAFGGATALFQNFIQGPTYDFIPLAFSTMGRATMNSMPGMYTLLPARMGHTWKEDLVIISTPWKNYTISSLYDGSFFHDVEAPEVTPGKERRDEIKKAETTAATDWGEVRDSLDQQITEQGCVCAGGCSTSFGGPLTGVLDMGENSNDSFVGGLSRPWCYTIGSCGQGALRVRFSLNVFNIIHVKRWDFCGGDSKPADAGPGFEFFPGVNTEKSFVLLRVFAAGESYSHDGSLGVEQQKSRCLTDPACVGFDSEGYLKRGTYYRPDKDWRGIDRVRGGVLQGLYMKRPEVHSCQEDCSNSTSWWHTNAKEVCGSDDLTYKSQCDLKNAQCWKPDLQLKSEGPCNTAYQTPQGCTCTSACGAKKNRGKFHDKGCYVKGACGFTSSTGKRWDHCMGSDGLDTGRGFEYFAQITVPGSVLRKAGWFDTFHTDKLQEECGEDIECGGFTSDGTLLTHEFRDKPRHWKVSGDSKMGVYRKKASVAACQKDCTGASETPVCHEAKRRTFRSLCAGQNYRCLHGKDLERKAFPGTNDLHGEDSGWKTFPGPCQRFGDTGLHGFGQRWVERVSKLGPPGVPTTCMWITDVETQLSWSYTDFLTKGTVMETSEGDGTVNAASAYGPCRLWQSQQKQKVTLVPLKLGGASHVTMLFHKGFLDVLKHTLYHDRKSCHHVDGAIISDTEEWPNCKCSFPDTKVLCDNTVVAERNFNVEQVLNDCNEYREGNATGVPVRRVARCGHCGLVKGARSRNSVGLPSCKCADDDHKVFCPAPTGEVAERKFDLSDALRYCSFPTCAAAQE